MQNYYIRMYYKHSKTAASLGAQDEASEGFGVMVSPSSPTISISRQSVSPNSQQSASLDSQQSVCSESVSAALLPPNPGQPSSGPQEAKSNRFTSLYHWLTSAPTCVGVPMCFTYVSAVLLSSGGGAGRSQGCGSNRNNL